MSWPWPTLCAHLPPEPSSHLLLLALEPLLLLLGILLLPGILLLQVLAWFDITLFRSLLSGPLLALSQRVPLTPFSCHFLSLCLLVFFGFVLFHSLFHGLTLYYISPLVKCKLHVVRDFDSFIYVSPRTSCNSNSKLVLYDK